MRAYARQQLPEQFKRQPKTEVLNDYISRKYSKYGYRKNSPIAYNPESKENHYRWVEHISDGLREVDEASKIIRLDHTGWFVDNFQDETVHGIVYRLPARDGKEQFAPAVNDPWNQDCALVDFHSITDDKEDAARWADSMAERYAEKEREFQAEESAKMRIEDINEEIKKEYQEFRRISRELRANCAVIQGIEVIRELVRDKWKVTKATIHRLRTERERIETYGIEY